MLRKRLITAAVIIPIGLTFIFLGGWFFAFFIAVVLAISAWEYWHIYQKGGYAPNAPVLFTSVILLAFFRYQYGFQGSDILLALSVLIAMAFATMSFELNNKTSSLDFGITLGGILYIGWLGSYLISLRFLPDGQWWLLLSILSVALADSGAYFIGSRFGRNKMAPRVSPKKTWEGYLGGVIACIIGGGLFGSIFSQFSTSISIINGVLIGAVLGVLTPLGDLGESMLKRQFDIKDSGNFLPGHGGFLDRIDSWLWAAAISYYMILWFFI